MKNWKHKVLAENGNPVGKVCIRFFSLIPWMCSRGLKPANVSSPPQLTLTVNVMALGFAKKKTWWYRREMGGKRLNEKAECTSCRIVWIRTVNSSLLFYPLMKYPENWWCAVWINPGNFRCNCTLLMERPEWQTASYLAWFLLRNWSWWVSPPH